MRSIEKELVSEESIEQGLNVTLHNNLLDKEGSYYARVNTRVANVKAALKLIKDEERGVDITAIKHGLELYNKQVMKLLELGFSVKVLDLGILTIKHRGRIKDRGAAESLSDFTVDFIPSEDVRKAVSNLSVDAVLTVDNSPVLAEVADLSRKASDGMVTIGQPMAVKGRNLKVCKDDEIIFVPQDDDGRNIEDEAKWVKVAEPQLFRNKPTELNFFVPMDIGVGKYRIVVKSTCLGNGHKRHSPLMGRSDVVSVLAG